HFARNAPQPWCYTLATESDICEADQSRTIRLGLFEVDLRTGELCKNGVKIKLQEQFPSAGYSPSPRRRSGHARRIASGTVARGYICGFRARSKRGRQAATRCAWRVCRKSHIH